MNRIMIQEDIKKHIQLIADAISWAQRYGKDGFPTDVLKEYRRKLKKIASALNGNCSAAAYGESQVGKSYLMSSLLSTAESPFMISNGSREYSFIDELNPSGGNNAKIESTGVITRFTLAKDDDTPSNMVKVKNLSVVDLILLITDSYYNDIRINPDMVMKYDDINDELDKLSYIWQSRTVQQTCITEDDVKDIAEYVKEIIGNNASNVYQSNFSKVIAPVIEYVPFNKWVDVFCLLWNRNEEMSHLFSTLIDAYKNINFTTEVYVPFDAVLREKGTLLKIDWLDSVCGIKTESQTDTVDTDVYDLHGNLLASHFGKGYLSALIAEITFCLPNELATDRKFLTRIDLLDFPGARSREKYKEQEIKSVLSKVLRRGKVAYLFNKYSRTLRISAVLFCHHNDQKADSSIGETVNSWIENNIGRTPQERETMLSLTKGIAPLFMVATKFNIDLERLKTDTPLNVEKLDAHWNRFDTVLPEIIKPNNWFDQWTPQSSSTRSTYFRNIYPLRDFYWSSKNGLFDGYSEGKKKSGETGLHIYPDYPDYMDRLKESFLEHHFVKKHFAHPEETWNSVATPNNDGSKVIIRSLDEIAGVLDQARTKRYTHELITLKEKLYELLTVYFESDDKEERNNKAKKVAGDIRRSMYMRVGEQPEIFGKIIDMLMIQPGDIRDLAYNIIVCHTESPRDFSQITFLRKTIGIDPDAPREENLQKLCEWGCCDEAQLQQDFEAKGFTIEDVIRNKHLELTTVADVLTHHIINLWKQHINLQATLLNELIPHADELIFMLFCLLDKLNIRQRLSERIDLYIRKIAGDSSINAIADFASLTLNNFVSSVGREYMDEADVNQVKQKAEACSLNIDFAHGVCAPKRKRQDLIATLSAFNDSQTIETVNFETLRKLPLWNSFERWQNLTLMGLLLVSDISHFDPEANAELRKIMDQCSTLYI